MNKQQEVSEWPEEGLLSVVLISAMALPMLILYATGSLAPYMLADQAIQPELLGAFTLASFGIAAVLSLWMGAWVSRLGLRASLMLLFGATGVAFTALVLTHHWLAMLLAIAVCGVAQALANPATNHAIASQVAPERRALMVGMKQSGVQMSALVAGSVLPWLADLWGWRGAFIVMIPFCVAMLFITGVCRWRTITLVQQQRRDRDKSQQALTCLMLMQGGIGIVLAAFITQVPVFALGLGMDANEAAFLITVLGLMGMLSRILITSLASRCRLENDILMILLLVAGIAIVATFSATRQHLWLLYAGVVGIGGTIVATNALAMSMILKHGCFGNIPTASGRVSMAFFAGLASGALLFQAVVLYGGIEAGVVAMLGVLGFCVVVVVRLRGPILRLLESNK